ncbi:SOS response-associated peptidase [Paenibacillus agaridevorans]|nr:SOS response-associated peptidase [Paenibacillus agaridevorans]
MCGRYTLVVSIEELMDHYLIENLPEPFAPRYNIAPTQMVLAVINDGSKNQIGQLKWGLVPTWSKTEKEGFKMINARAETVVDKPAFRTAFQRKRCLIPADGFYEWQRRPDGSKQPYRIVLKDVELFSFAGLYETWISPEGNKVSTCTIITTTPNKLMANIHDRMPVILPHRAEATWLNKETPTADLTELMQPYPDEELEAYPVSSAVGNVKNNSDELIKRN